MGRAEYVGKDPLQSHRYLVRHAGGELQHGGWSHELPYDYNNVDRLQLTSLKLLTPFHILILS